MVRSCDDGDCCLSSTSCLNGKTRIIQTKTIRFFYQKLGAFPVNREKPGPSAIKYPVQQIKEIKKALVIFPTGTRYSNEMKGGAVMIARLAKAPIVPMVYQGLLTFKDIIKRKKMHVRIVDPIYIADQKLTKEEIANYDKC